MLNIIKSNNPMAIRYNAANKWVGQVGESKGFAVFQTPVHGIRAGMRLLQSAYIAKGHNTLTKIFARYAPTADGNRPEIYAQRVLTLWNTGMQTGFRQRTILTSVTQVIPNTPDNLAVLASCIIEVECGNNVFNTFFDKESIVLRSWDYFKGSKIKVLKNTASELFIEVENDPNTKGLEPENNLKKKSFTTPGVNEAGEKKKIILFVLLAIVALILIKKYVLK